MTLNYSSVALNMQKQDYWFYNGGIASEDNLQNAVNSGAIEVKVDDLAVASLSPGSLIAVPVLVLTVPSPSIIQAITTARAAVRPMLAAAL